MVESANIAPEPRIAVPSSLQQAEQGQSRQAIPGSLVRLRPTQLAVTRRLLIANVSIVAIGAVFGTWITAASARSLPDSSLPMLMLGFAIVGLLLSIVVNHVAINAILGPLDSLNDVASAVRRGDLSARADVSRFTDTQIRDLVETFNRTLNQLEVDQEMVRSLASQVIRAQEDERKRIARELHDDTAQILYAQLLRIPPLKQSDDLAVRQTAELLESMTSEAIEGVRRLALELRPPALDDLGLQAALEGLANRYGDEFGLAIDFSSRGPRIRLPAEVELVIYRVAQEALSNVAKHAEATTVLIDLDRDAASVSISIRDNGKGFNARPAHDADRPGLGMGIFGMEERVVLVRGQLSIWSKAREGTEIFAIIPLNDTDPLS
jgi:two-component system, NarL family, sensor histidine kinase UhpB